MSMLTEAERILARLASKDPTLTRVVLNGDCSEIVLVAILEAMSENTTVEELELRSLRYTNTALERWIFVSDRRMQERILRLVAAGVEHHPKLRHFHIHEMSSSPDGLNVLFLALAKCKSLCGLTIERVDFRGVRGHSLHGAAESLFNLGKTLESLHISHCWLREIMFDYEQHTNLANELVLQFMGRRKNRLEHLRTLNLAGITGRPAKLVCRALPNLPALESLVVDGCNVPLLGAVPQVPLLLWPRLLCKQASDPNAIFFFLQAKMELCAAATTTMCKLSGKHKRIDYCVQPLPNGQEIFLISPGISPVPDPSWPKQEKELCTRLASNDPTLIRVLLQGACSNSLPAVFNALKDNATVEELMLRSVPLGDGQVPSLATRLRRHPNLRHLHVCDMTLHDFHLLTLGIGGSRSLCSFTIERVSIETSQWDANKAFVFLRKRMESLRIRDCWIEYHDKRSSLAEECLSYISRKKNRLEHLKTLQLDGFRGDRVKLICGALPFLPAIESFVLHGRSHIQVLAGGLDLPLSLWPHVLSRESGDLNAIFLFLRESPELFCADASSTTTRRSKPSRKRKRIDYCVRILPNDQEAFVIPPECP